MQQSAQQLALLERLRQHGASMRFDKELWFASTCRSGSKRSRRSSLSQVSSSESVATVSDDNNAESAVVTESRPHQLAKPKIISPTAPRHHVTPSLLYFTLLYMFNVLGTNWGPTDRVLFM